MVNQVITRKEIASNLERPLMQYTVNNGNGYAFTCLNYGATLTSIMMPDRNGIIDNILLGFNGPTDFLNDQTYFFGKAIGRVGGRIKGGLFHYKNQEFLLPRNEGDNTLHGGVNGFHHMWWDVSETEKGLTFTKVINPEMDGFPGKLEVTITYRWGENNQFHVEFYAINKSDTPTLFNPTTHIYFNLNNDKLKGLNNHKLSISAEQLLELDQQQIPTGEFINVTNTPFDFRKEQNLSEMLHSLKQIHIPGYDHPYHVTGPKAARLSNLNNGRIVEIQSDRNGLVFYSLNKTHPHIKVNEGNHLFPHMAVALEPQTLPDANHHPDFGDIVLPANTEKKYEITYKLSVI